MSTTVPGTPTTSALVTGQPVRRTAIMGERKVVRRASHLSYAAAIAKGLWFTLKAAFKKKATRQYPEEKLSPGPSFHGIPLLVEREDGSPRCVACGLCEFVCPPRAISIIPTETPSPIERVPETFVIDMLRCIECGYCEEVCPEEAIVLSEKYELVGGTRESFVWGLDRLLKPLSFFGPRIDYIRKLYAREKAGAERAPPPGGVPNEIPAANVK